MFSPIPTCSLEEGSLWGSMVRLFRSSDMVWRWVISPSIEISSSWRAVIHNMLSSWVIHFIVLVQLFLFGSLSNPFNLSEVDWGTGTSLLKALAALSLGKWKGKGNLPLSVTEWPVWRGQWWTKVKADMWSFLTVSGGWQVSSDGLPVILRSCSTALQTKALWRHSGSTDDTI